MRVLRKGQPSQVSAVSHGSSTTRFDGINVINTARSLPVIRCKARCTRCSSCA